MESELIDPDVTEPEVTGPEVTGPKGFLKVSALSILRGWDRFARSKHLFQPLLVVNASIGYLSFALLLAVGAFLNSQQTNGNNRDNQYGCHQCCNIHSGGTEFVNTIFVL